MTIKNCFKHSGFIKSNEDINNKGDKGDDLEKEIDTEKDDIKNESILLDKLKDKVNFDIYKYISIDDKLSSYNTLTDEEIVSSVKENLIQIIPDIEIETDSNDSQNSRVKILSTEAISCLDTIKLFLQQDESYLDKIYNHIDFNKRSHQQKLDKFLVKQDILMNNKE